MSVAEPIQTHRVAVMPFWPRVLSAELAAAYMGISRTNFLARVAKHMLPAPKKIGDRVVWDIRVLDQFIDVLFEHACEGVAPKESW